MPKHPAAKAPPEQQTSLHLQSFLPYRLVVLADQVSHCIAHIYSDRFNLTRPEWRALVALVELGPVSATEIAAHSTLDKMSTSRAIKGLEEKGYLRRADAAEDRRNKIINLTAAGRGLYNKIAPLVLAQETYLLEIFSADERSMLDRLLRGLEQRAQDLQKQN
ncbi:MarR family transcriptional regulator [Acidocella aquatica]|uniref:MarR family transcriptional regulator n=2 Tax=Acidocella aquatica TaxID=1922313 RepID=A0ABQ6ACG0_9PROT|nr:MarR family transcriptional regulator [Acidocella aquatica]